MFLYEAFTKKKVLRWVDKIGLKTAVHTTTHLHRDTERGRERQMEVQTALYYIYIPMYL